MKKWISSWKVWLTVSAVLTAVGVVGLLGRRIMLFWQLLRLHAVPTGAASVGIIGGADGPTAIFVTSPTGGPRVPWYGFPILTIAGIVGLWWSLRKRKEEQ